MPRGAAGHDVDLCDLLNDLIRDTDLTQIDASILDREIQSILYSSGLLVDLLHHEVLEAGLISSLRGECDLNLFFGNLVAVQVIENCLAGREPSHLQVADIVNLVGVFEDRGNIGRDVCLIVCDADDHGAVFSGYPDLAGIIKEHHCQRIGAPDTDHGLGDRVDRSDIIFFIVVIHQLDDHFGICLAVKLVTVPEKLVFQLLIVLDDTVVHANYNRFDGTGS